MNLKDIDEGDATVCHFGCSSLTYYKHCFLSEMERNDNSNCENGKFPSETTLLFSSDMLVDRKVSSFL